MEIETRRKWKDEIFVSHGTNSARGVALLIHSRLEHNVRQIHCNNTYIHTYIHTYIRTYTLFNLGFRVAEDKLVSSSYKCDPKYY